MGFSKYIEEHTKVVSDNIIKLHVVEQAKILKACFEKGKKLLVAGNGGSAVDASHFVAEFVNRIRPAYDRPALPALALTTDMAIVTSIANDNCYSSIFSKQIEALGNAEDVFIGITTSGSSQNISEALIAAKKKGMITIIWRGNKYGTAPVSVDYDAILPTTNTAICQEVMLMMAHLLVFETENLMYFAPL